MAVTAAPAATAPRRPGVALYANLTDAPATFAGFARRRPDRRRRWRRDPPGRRPAGDRQRYPLGQRRGRRLRYVATGVCDADPDDNGIGGHQRLPLRPRPAASLPAVRRAQRLRRRPVAWGSSPQRRGGQRPPGLSDPGGPFEHTGHRPPRAAVPAAASSSPPPGSRSPARPSRPRGGNGGTGRGSVPAVAGLAACVKVVAPIQTGVMPPRTSAPVCPATRRPADALSVPLNPIALARRDRPGHPGCRRGDGEVVEVGPPFSEILPFGQFWYPGRSRRPGGFRSTAYLLGASQEGVANSVSIVTCAVTAPVARSCRSPRQANPQAPPFTMPTTRADDRPAVWFRGVAEPGAAGHGADLRRRVRAAGSRLAGGAHAAGDQPVPRHLQRGASGPRRPATTASSSVTPAASATPPTASSSRSPPPSTPSSDRCRSPDDRHHLARMGRCCR